MVIIKRYAMLDSDITDTISEDVTRTADDRDDVLAKIDQYELVRELGGGGFGVVYLARDTVSGVDYAVKGLPPFVKNNREEMANIKANFALVSRLSNTHIARAHVLHPVMETWYGSEDVRRKLRIERGDALMVMEYAPGTTLSRWRNQFGPGGVPLENALEIVSQIAEALDYAHEQRILHRDIKPANVMVETKTDGELVVRILDFGLAAEIRSSMGRVSQEIHDTSGTRPYMAPEQWLGRRQNAATDQYALAVLFHELITGEVPFSAVFDTGDPVVMMNVVGREPFKARTSLPRHVRRALEKALAKNPEERFKTCKDFVAALEGKSAGAGRSGKSARLLVFCALPLAVCAVAAWAWWNANAKNAAPAQLPPAPQPFTQPKPLTTKPGTAAPADEAALKREAFLLKGKASQARDRNKIEEWIAWPHFSSVAKDLESYYRAGEDALNAKDYALAKEMFEHVRECMVWLSSNKDARVEADKARANADEKRNAAADAATYASDTLAKAIEKWDEAVKFFNSGDFHKAKTAFDEAGAFWSQAAETAKTAKEEIEANERELAMKNVAENTRLAIEAFRSERWDEGFKYSEIADRDDKTIQFYLGVCYHFGYGVEKDDAESVRWYIKSAEQGDRDAQFNLGVCYENGEGVSVNKSEAVNWYRKAAEQGHASAQFNLGVCYANGEGVSVNKSEAVNWYRKAAEQGDRDAQFNLALMYANGEGVSVNKSEAVNWYRKAAEQGYAKAQLNLGLMYEDGEGVPKNEREAVNWYRKAAEQNNASAQYCLAVNYDNGIGVAINKSEAIKWYRKAAEQGHVKAQLNLGIMYENGEGVSVNKSEAVNWYRKAAEQGYAKAQLNLGIMYEYGEGVPKNDREAVNWYRKAAEQNNASAQYCLAVNYDNGIGVAINKSEAIKWYRKAAEQGHAKAQLNLGIMYENGEGVPKDDREAVNWYRKAAEQNNASAQYCLAVNYDNGIGVAINKSEAIKWYRKAAEQGHAKAQTNLGYMYGHGEGVPKDNYEAVKWYQKAADQGYATAQCNLGIMYENGTGVYKSIPKAVEWYRKAAAQGHENAQKALRRLGY